MAFGSNDFPLGPNGQFPRNRVHDFGNQIAPPNRVEDVYRRSTASKLPVVERDFSTSVERAKHRMKMGREMRKGQAPDRFQPRYKQGESPRPINRGFTSLITPMIRGQRMNARLFSGRIE